MTEDTRDLFERTFALCSRQAWRTKDGSYKNPFIQGRWEGWQRALETVQTDPMFSSQLASAAQTILTDYPHEAALLRMAVQLAKPAPTAQEPIAWVTKAALRHWAEHKGEGPQEYTFLPRALNGWDMQDDLQVPLYTAPSDKDKRIAELENALREVLHAGRGTSGRIILDKVQELAARKALDAAAPAQTAPEGYVLVPVRPTDAMHSVMLDWGTKKSEWEAILAAAQLATPAQAALSERNAVLEEVAEYLEHLNDSAGDSAAYDRRDMTDWEKGSKFALNLAVQHLLAMQVLR